MSRFEDRQLRCPHCTREFTESIATSLNVTNKPQLRDAILTGQFQRFTCPDCHKAFVVDDALMYIDFGRKIWIGMFPQSSEAHWYRHEALPRETFDTNMTGPHTSPYAREMADGFIVRAVFGLPALAEKIRCLEAGVDDAVLAILKLQMMQTIEGLRFNPQSRPTLVGVEESQLIFRARTSDGENGESGETLVIPREALGEIDDNQEAYASVIKQLTEGPYVDVGRIMFAPENEG
jgi:hypothetical protein